MYFWLCWVFVLCGLFSSCGELGLLSSGSAWVSHYGGFSCGAEALGHMGLVVPQHVESYPPRD